MPKRKVKPEYIYLIREGTTDHYKLGRSVNVQRRLKQLNSGNPRPLHIRYSLKKPDAKNVEKSLHIYYASHRLDTEYEWFTFTEAETVKVCEKIKTV